MFKIFSSLSKTIQSSIALTILLFLFLFFLNGGFVFDTFFWSSLCRFVHVIVAIMWIGLLWYFNFVQIPNMSKIPDDQKPALNNVITPATLFYFRWAAFFTIISGLILALMNDYLYDAMTLSIGSGIPKHTAVGIGMWLGLIMAFNVWFIIWPNQKRVLGMIESEIDLKEKSARIVLITSRINTLLSIPMLFTMVTAQNLY
tara:strand:+ start:2914 stop:3516 length:603 start_codon:yes stop_codon:yes gene_type:complete